MRPSLDIPTDCFYGDSLLIVRAVEQATADTFGIAIADTSEPAIYMPPMMTLDLVFNFQPFTEYFFNESFLYYCFDFINWLLILNNNLLAKVLYFVRLADNMECNISFLLLNWPDLYDCIYHNFGLPYWHLRSRFVKGLLSIFSILKFHIAFEQSFSFVNRMSFIYFRQYLKKHYIFWLVIIEPQTYFQQIGLSWCHQQHLKYRLCLNYAYSLCLRRFYFRRHIFKDFSRYHFMLFQNDQIYSRNVSGQHN